MRSTPLNITSHLLWPARYGFSPVLPCSVCISFPLRGRLAAGLALTGAGRDFGQASERSFGIPNGIAAFARITHTVLLRMRLLRVVRFNIVVLGGWRSIGQLVARVGI